LIEKQSRATTTAACLLGDPSVAIAMARRAPPPEVKAIAPAVAAEHRPASPSPARL
jgi:hypothetical protein